MKEKHLPYYKVLDSLKAQECPVCFLVKDSVEKYFADILYEKITDVEFNKKLRETRGFCNFHSYKFLNFNDSLAITLTHKLLIQDAIKELNNPQSHKISKNISCILCNYTKDAEKRYLSVIKDYLNDDEFKENFLKSSGLCIPHFKTYLLKPKNTPKWLIDFQNEKFQDCLSMMMKFLDAHEQTNKVKVAYDNDIWKKAVKIFSGFEGNTN
jgi:hypothetical protein